MSKEKPAKTVIDTVKGAAKTVADNLNVRKASRTLDRIVEQEAPRPKSPNDARFVRGLGERIGFAGIVAATVVAALLGATGCVEKDGTPSPRAPYSEDASKPDYACKYDGNRRCPADGSVNR